MPPVPSARRQSGRRRLIARLNNLLAGPLNPLLFQLSLRRLKHRLPITGIPDIVNATFSYRGFGYYQTIRSIQNRHELQRLVERFQQVQPRVIVEIGTHQGGTLFSFVRSNPQAELVVSIDLPGGQFGGGYSEPKIRLFQQFVADRPQTQLACLRVDSHQASTLTELQRLLAGRPIDALFIDGDHRYDGVRQDFLMYGPLVRRGGLIAFHDIRTDHRDHDVMRFWHEIRDRYQVEEVCFAEKAVFGIGIITVDRPITA
jgi:cephalosporin hydroxylase